MNSEVVITCAVTGAGDTVAKHPGVPVTPKQIADAAIEAAKAGAAIAHCHVRDPESGKGARDPALYREVVERIRGSATDVVIARPVVMAQPQPVYMWVPPGHRKDWGKHCRHYNACGVPVYFVRHDWYNNHVMAAADSRGNPGQGGGSGHGGPGHGKGKGKGHGKGHD